jgi:predicted alpha/beta hydrolase
MEANIDPTSSINNTTDVVKTARLVESADGHKADLVVFRPLPEKISVATPVLVVHPAMGVAGAYYDKLAESLVIQYGLVVAVQEQRGQGSSNWRASSSRDWSFWEPITQDFHLHLAIIRQEFASNPIFVLGHSVGSFLWNLWLAKQLLEKNDKNFNEIRGLVLIACGSIHSPTHPSRILLPYSYFVSFVCHVLGWWPGAKLGFGDSEAKSFMLDWAHTIWHGNWQPRDCPYPNITESFRRIKKPTLFLSIDSDAFTPPVCTALFASRFDPQYTSMVVINAAAEEEFKGMTGEQVHIRWARTNVMLPHISTFVRRCLAFDTPRLLAKL